MSGMFTHIAMADKRDGIPSIADAKKCALSLCPGPHGFEFAFGLAGGGYGPYVFCNVCDEVRGKDCSPEDEA